VPFGDAFITAIARPPKPGSEARSSSSRDRGRLGRRYHLSRVSKTKSLISAVISWACNSAGSRIASPC